jgi:hypothetical protein
MRSAVFSTARASARRGAGVPDFSSFATTDSNIEERGSRTR